MSLKHHGEVKYSFECFGPSLKKGRHKLAIGILQQMYGKDKKWLDLMKEMEQAIMDARQERGAGEKPVLQKYDRNYLVEGQQQVDEDKENSSLNNESKAAIDANDERYKQSASYTQLFGTGLEVVDLLDD